MVKSSIVRTLRNEDEEGEGDERLFEDENVEKYRMNGKADDFRKTWMRDWFQGRDRRDSPNAD
jgi:hypothetical protein